MFEESAKYPVKPYLAQPGVGYGLNSDEKELLPDGSCLSPRRIVKSGNLVDDAGTTVEVGVCIYCADFQDLCSTSVLLLRGSMSEDRLGPR